MREVTRRRGVTAKDPVFEYVFDSLCGVRVSAGDGTTTDYAGTTSGNNQQEQWYDQRNEWTGRLVRDEPAERIKGGASVWCGAST
ncbi:hypothetical protein GCM10017557_36660 [Streptomyces aurantiacus]|uniref:Uncharacterized protein n=1 Tax=Streptomyces aurantiacus TaxID=47760 RepID=A0A7G1P4R7_9ACTN|nr:hypothetical protein GCM10017557_36660 [Streptomyces aurantiacus]